MVVGGKKGNKVGNRGLILYSSVLGDSVPCVTSHPVLPAAQAAVSADAALFKLRIVKRFTQEPS